MFGSSCCLRLHAKRTADCNLLICFNNRKIQGLTSREREAYYFCPIRSYLEDLEEQRISAGRD